MIADIVKTAERVSANEISDHFVFQRCKAGYCEAAKILSGKVLEIGTGDGYGISQLLPYVDQLVTIDKNNKNIIINNGSFKDLRILKIKAPSLQAFSDESFDAVVIFHVIEHIKNDTEMIHEIYRVLKPGGTLLISTPNKSMSLTRNPWHVREYFPDGLTALLQKRFDNISPFGIFGNGKVMDYYQKNKEAVKKITRFDIFDFQYRLPRWLLQIPYDILNRINRRKLLAANADLTESLEVTDFYVKPLSSNDSTCLDLFYIAVKQAPV